MIFNPDGSEKTDQCLQRPISIEAHAQGMKADFIYGNWVLAQNESLEIDPATATLDDPTEDGYIKNASIREDEASVVQYGGWDLYSYRGYVEWPIGSIAGGTLTANPLFKYHGYSQNAISGGEINPIANQPSMAATADLWADIATGVAYVDPFTLVVAENQSQDLGAAAKTDLQTAMTAEQSWWALGFQAPDSEYGKLNFLDAFYSE
ncbi:unnamed protein product, partial [marine sediment metagenome]